jgi:hypothetical protein
MEDKKKLKARIDWLCENKINAFSPTISPAFKNKDRNEIESIQEAVKYFVKHGQTELIFQKKYMGSYCDIYLHKNIDDTYLVSRNGHKITHIDLEKAKASLVELHHKLDWTNTKLLIIQSELLPWSVLGKGLIDNEFGGYLATHETHHEYLSSTNLYAKIAQIKDSEPYLQYQKSKAEVSAKELAQLYASHIIRQYNAIENFKQLDLAEYKQGIKTYRTQINHFGAVGDIYFKPFNILKKVFDDGTEELVNDNWSYATINDDECRTIKIDIEKDIAEQLEEIYEWYNSLVNNLEEGIMIKPRRAFIKDVAPAFKVRNNNYLTMIYGVNFIPDYDEYLGKRNIKRKLECSINDWMQNWELLKTPYKNIDKENYAFKNIALDRILGEQIENNLDHRL